MTSKVVLSVSLLTGGKKKELRQCLDSLKALREAVKTEMVIVDTGCDSEHREIIEAYADKIVNFTWCDDFSAARNAGLKECVGEWFLYLDDDEWFEDMSEIVDFFQSGEYCDFDYAMYKQRNYEDFQGRKYNDARVGRMIKRTADTHFIYSIHECFADVGSRTKYFDAYVHHYGYVYENDEARLLHSRRNLVPLLKECERDPENLRHLLQLAQEYRVLKEYEKAEQLGCSAIECYDSEDNEQIYYFNSLMVLTLNAIAKQKKTKKLTELGEQLRNHPYVGKLAEAYICAILSYGHRENGNYLTAIQRTQDYLGFLEDFRHSPKSYIVFETGILAPCFRENLVHATLENGILAAIAAGDLRLAAKWNQQIGWEKDELFVGKVLIEKNLEALLCGEAQLADALSLCNAMLKNTTVTAYAKRYLEQKISELSEEEAARLKYRCSQLRTKDWCADADKALQQTEGATAEEVRKLLWHYEEEQKAWYALLEAEMKDSHRQTTNVIEGLKEASEKGNVSDTVDLLKQLYGLKPEWAGAIKLCVEEQKKMQTDSEQEELAMLAKQIKLQVQAQIHAGQLQQARQILLQLQAMLPGDEEVREMLEELGNI